MRSPRTRAVVNSTPKDGCSVSDPFYGARIGVNGISLSLVSLKRTMRDGACIDGSINDRYRTANTGFEAASQFNLTGFCIECPHVFLVDSVLRQVTYTGSFTTVGGEVIPSSKSKDHMESPVDLAPVLEVAVAPRTPTPTVLSVPIDSVGRILTATG